MRTVRLLLLALLVPVLAKPANPGETQRVEEVAFDSHGATLAGSIVFPENEEIHSAIVFVHGSGEQTRNLLWAQRFAKDGIVALVYDKRGVGKSGGRYESEQSVSEKNISLLADDAVSALKVLASHPSLKGIPVGIAGVSQAGWIAPLAAERSGLARYIILWSGPVCRVSEEDIFSKYTSDAEGQVVPSYGQALRSRTEKYVWAEFLGKDTDPSESLSKLSIPGLWIFSDNDGSIPVDLSIARLQRLRRVGHRYDYVLFSGLGHNNMSRSFATATDWIRSFSK
jgi:pimeloyl-ACP methyl ester carboxylesterase